MRTNLSAKDARRGGLGVFLASLLCVMSLLAPWAANKASAETSGDYSYTVNSGGASVSITKYSGSSETVDIPSTLGGLPVTVIAEAAFKGNSAMATVIVPEGVTKIEKDAFYKCTSLRNVYLPASLTSAVSGKASGSHGSFHGCPGGRSCYGPDGSYAQKFAADDGVGFVVASTVRFVTNGGTAVTTQIVAKNSTATDAAATKTGYSLDGWYTGEAFTTKYLFDTPVTGNMTLYAKWNINTYTVTFEVNGGTTVDSQVVEFNSTLPDVSTSKDDYHLIGWYTEPSFENEFKLDSPVTGDMTLYAKWESDYSYAETTGGIKITGYSGDKTELVIPSTIDGKQVVAIGHTNYGAFQDNQSITAVVIPEGVTTIENSAFCGCSKLARVELPSTLTSIEHLAFAKTAIAEISLPEKMTAIGDGAFMRCESLKSVALPDGLTYVAEYAFGDCTSLESISIPASVQYVGHMAFAECTSLKSIAIPEGVAQIEFGLFMGCTSLQSASLPSTIERIDSRAFWRCSSLEAINLPDSLEQTRIEGSTFEGCTSLKSIAIPEGVTVLGDNAFNGCTSLESVTLPSTLQEIEESAFYGCSALTSIVVPEGVTSIGDAAFKGCTSLERADLPSTLTTMGSDAFKGCRRVSFYGPHTAAAHDYAQDNYIPEYHQVTFLTNGGPKVDEAEVLCGKAVSAPQVTGYTCKACYVDATFQSAYDFSAAVCDNLTLYVEWALDTYAVSFAANGGAEVENQTVQYDKQASEPQTSRDGYTFLGWYADEGLTQKYDFATPVTCDITLYAKWDVTVPSSFDDVATGDWYHKWVSEAARLGIMTGYKDAEGAYTGSFGPEDSVTRGQVATVLWRLAGSPAASDGGVFPDVAAGQYYSQAVSWAYANGIITGYTAGEHAGTFQPDASVSREEFAVMVYRFAAWEGVQTSGAPESAFDSCADTANVPGWSRDAMVWCAAAGVITGKDVAGGPLLAPQAGATRAEAAKILVVTSRLVGGEVPYALDDADEAVEAQAIESEAEQPVGQAEEVTFDDVTLEDVAATEPAAQGESGQVAVEADLIEADAAADDAGKAAVEATTAGEQAALDDVEFDDIAEALAA